MRNWNIVAIASILGAALIVLVVRQASNAAHHTEDAAPAVSKSEIQQSPPPQKMFGDRKPEGEYGWGPVRATDW